MSLSAQSPTFRAGTRAIALPSPRADLVETGSDARQALDYMVPEGNRMVAAFVTGDDLRFLRAGQLHRLTAYGVVEVQRSAEFTDASSADFATVVQMMNEQFGVIFQGAVKDQQQPVNERLKALNAKAAWVTLEKPVQLGNWFTKTDAVGYGIAEPVKSAGETVNMAGGIAVVRVNERLLFAYFYEPIVDDTTIDTVRTTTEHWVDAILAANRK
ncbi:MAG TPA: hypothetical protein VME68_06530 [Acidobacteriaceae bacterium]|nr:hypothetical protein [Acidobacteriaceae bacterium]